MAGRPLRRARHAQAQAQAQAQAYARNNPKTRVLTGKNLPRTPKDLQMLDLQTELKHVGVTLLWYSPTLGVIYYSDCPTPSDGLGMIELEGSSTVRFIGFYLPDKDRGLDAVFRYGAVGEMADKIKRILLAALSGQHATWKDVSRVTNCPLIKTEKSAD